MDAGQANHSLAAVLRVAFSIVIIAALAVDAWTNEGVASRSSALMVGLVALLGIGWACHPTTTTTSVVAVYASLLSLMATTNGPRDAGAFPFFTEFVVLPVLFGAVLVSIKYWRWPIGALLAFAAESIALRAEPGPIRWIVATSMLVLLGAAITAVVYMRLRDNERRTSVEMARQSERLDLARELHDVVGHYVTGIVVLAQASRFAAATGAGTAREPPEIDRTLSEIEAAGLETLTSVRRLVGLLRADPSISPGQTLEDIEKLVSNLRLTHPDVELLVDTVTRTEWVPPDLATTVHRLVQEATTNVRKHGDPSTSVAFHLRRSGTSIELTVENRSLRGPVGSGYGLIGVRERVEAFGGTFSAGPDHSGGWVLRTTLPLIETQRP